MEAHYRAGDMHLSAVGTLVAETEKSVFVEEHFSHNGKDKTIRFEIPVEYLIRVLESTTQADNSVPVPGRSTTKQS
ncbi:MAG TPA: hypothetical protein VLY23_15970 [Candidatus Acidoferrum sp.]|nr:hypothetical protein [Candidatus Acidoferrum sp.]